MYLLPRIIKCEVIVVFASGFLFILKETELNVTLFPSSVPSTILPPSLGNQYYNVCILPAFVTIFYYLTTYIYLYVKLYLCLCILNFLYKCYSSVHIILQLTFSPQYDLENYPY